MRPHVDHTCYGGPTFRCAACWAKAHSIDPDGARENLRRLGLGEKPEPEQQAATKNPIVHPFGVKLVDIFDNATLAKTLELIANEIQGNDAPKSILRVAAKRLSSDAAQLAAQAERAKYLAEQFDDAGPWYVTTIDDLVQGAIEVEIAGYLRHYATLRAENARLAEEVERLKRASWGACKLHGEDIRELSNNCASNDIEDDPCVPCGYVHALRALAAARAELSALKEGSK